jgi:hypothetical protein
MYLAALQLLSGVVSLTASFGNSGEHRTVIRQIFKVSLSGNFFIFTKNPE